MTYISTLYKIGDEVSLKNNKEQCLVIAGILINPNNFIEYKCLSKDSVTLWLPEDLLVRYEEISEYEK